MASEQVLKILGVVLFLVGVICVGGVVYYLIWGDWMVIGWNQFYTWLIIIGLPCLFVGGYLANKYIR